jgi:hypothetical protein
VTVMQLLIGWHRGETASPRHWLRQLPLTATSEDPKA